MAGFVFLSHSRADHEYAGRMATFLRDAGIDVWIDNEIHYGDQWRQVLESKVEGCRAIVVLMTPAARESAWVQREVALAEALDRPIFPVLLRGIAFPGLIEKHIEDVTDGRLPRAGFVERLRARLDLVPPPTHP